MGASPKGDGSRRGHLVWKVLRSLPGTKSGRVAVHGDRRRLEGGEGSGFRPEEGSHGLGARRMEPQFPLLCLEGQETASEDRPALPSVLLSSRRMRRKHIPPVSCRPFPGPRSRAAGAAAGLVLPWDALCGRALVGQGEQGKCISPSRADVGAALTGLWCEQGLSGLSWRQGCGTPPKRIRSHGTSGMATAWPQRCRSARHGHQKTLSRARSLPFFLSVYLSI